MRVTRIDKNLYFTISRKELLILLERSSSHNLEFMTFYIKTMLTRHMKEEFTIKDIQQQSRL